VVNHSNFRIAGISEFHVDRHWSTRGGADEIPEILKF
jgi:hypothetical protein